MNLNIFSVIPTFVQEVVDVNFVANSSSVRSGGAFGQDAVFTCTVDSWPLASIEWSYPDAIGGSRVSIVLNQSDPTRQESTLTFDSVDLEDDDTSFTCSATSEFGSISSTGTLGIFGESILCVMLKPTLIALHFQSFLK